MGRRFRNLWYFIVSPTRVVTSGTAPDDTPAPWLTLHEGTAEEWKVMTVKAVDRQHASDGRTGRFTVVDAPLWVNILPLTEDGRIICVEQFRHGTNGLTIEIPGGIVNVDEDPRLAAQRECAEETGWASDAEAELLGIIDPNPAFMRNKCHVYLWRGCTWRGLQQLDPHEDIRVHTMEMKDFFSMVKDGRIAHSLVLSAVALYNLHHVLPTTSALEISRHG